MVNELRYDGVPPDLRASACFCLWGYRHRNGKQTKVPYSPATGAKARANDQSTFGGFEDAVRALGRRPQEYDGLGVGLFGDLVGVDIDHCINDSGELSSVAKDIIDSLNSYTEISPSGRGVHVLCRAPGLSYGTADYYTKNSRLGVEIYAAGRTNRYLTLTGDVLRSCGAQERTAELKSVLDRYMRRGGTQPPTHAESTHEEAQVLDDAEVIDRMLSSAKGESIARLWAGELDGYSSQSEADLALCNHLAFWTGKNAEQIDRLFRQSGLMRGKWDRPQSGSTYGAITIERAVRDCTAVWAPGSAVDKREGVMRALGFLRACDAAHNPRYKRDDIGAGYLLADYLKPFARPLARGKAWVVYDGRRWSDSMGEAVVEEAAKDMSRALALYASELPDCEMKDYLDWAGKWTQRAKRKIYIQDAASPHVVSRGEFDRDPWLLNLNNGTLDLRTMELHGHDPDDLITHLAPVDYDPDAVCERWERFIGEIMEPGDAESKSDDGQRTGQEKALFLQRFFGYCLSGDTRAEAFLIMYGPTSRNGKSVFVETIQTLMGDYGKVINADTLLLSRARDGSGPSEDIARLNGTRMASVGEIPQGAKLDAARMKSLTGGDSVNARFLGENSFDFTPQFKLVLHTTHLPQCSDLSVFDSERALVLPFSRHFEPHEQDRTLKSEFSKPDNLSGVLNWLIAGLMEYKRIGLFPPTPVIGATREYRKDSDKIARFIEDVLEVSTDGEERTAYVYDVYKEWCRENGQYPESSKSFLRGLERAGLRIARARPKCGPGEKTTLLFGYRVSSSYLTAA